MLSMSVTVRRISWTKVWPTSNCSKYFPAIILVPSVHSAEDRNRGDAVERRAAEIVGQSEIDVFALPRSRAPEQLRIDLIRHAQTGRADGMSETFQAAVDLAGLR